MKWKYKLALWYMKNRRTVRIVVPLLVLAVAAGILLLR